MATSNRDRIGQGFELLAAGLQPFIDREVRAAKQGQDWLAMLQSRDGKRGSTWTYNRDDPLLLLRVLTEDAEVFKNRLSRPEQAFASELREVRNRWAHNEAFSPDDTYRALDTMERLLTAVEAADQAERVRKLRLDHQRAQYEQETRRAVKAASVASVPGAGLKPWREVLRPHPDVAAGRYESAEFAANLHLVATGDREVGEEYREPVSFFQRTYLTEGLRDLLDRASRRLTGDANASPVVNLQTNFGGGKTHSMLALYHLCSGTPTSAYPQEVQDVLAGRDLTAGVRRVALAAQYLKPGQVSVKDDGTQVHTIWGELAWQLGGREAYDLVADADRTATNPGDALRALISAYSPCLILIDEWVTYARQMYGQDGLPGGSFDTQFTFAQTLTETVASVPGAMLVLSIPASDAATNGDQAGGGSEEEVGGPYGREALRRLQNVVRRVAVQWRPASAPESFEIVRRRLFEEPDAAARRDISAVARQFVQFYAEHRGEFPRECAEIAYEERIRAAYPIHPELFDRLYSDWSTLDRFQRTRGVLRLMSTVVHALWSGDDPGPLIMAGSVPLAVPRVNSEITQYLPDAWRPIVDTDIDGEGSTPVRIDAERPAFGQRSLTRRLARTIFMGAAPTLHTPHKGIDRQRLWLGTAMPGDTVGNFGSAVEVLSQRATYLYVDDARYWFDTQASVTRTAQDHAARLREQPEEVWAELVRRLAAERATRGDFAAVHVCPEDTDAVPDTEDAKLVILHPRQVHSKANGDSAARQFAQQCLDNRGTAPRINRNTVVFLAPDSRRMEELTDAVCDYKAWNYVCARVEELNLTAQQKLMAERRRDQADEAVRLRIAATYTWVLVPEQPDPQGTTPRINAANASGSQERLAERVSAKLRQNGQLATKYGARNVRMDLDGPLQSAWSRGHISVGDLWSYYRRYPYLTRLADRSVLAEAVTAVFNLNTWEVEGFALAEGFDETSGRYLGLTIPHESDFGQVTDDTLLVLPTVARQQQNNDQASSGQDEKDTGTETPATSQTGTDTAPPPATAGQQQATNARFFGVIRLNPERYARDLTRVAQEVLQHLAADGVDLNITVEVSATKPDGFSDDKVHIITENARTLKFDQFGFEND